jgi:hypothetical protein
LNSNVLFRLSIASIAGASDTLISLLTRQLEVRPGSNPNGYGVKLFRSADYIGPPTNTISLFLYRVDADSVRRFGDSAAVPPSTPGARWQGLELSYLLTVWGQASASGEQRMLQLCMEILQEFAIVQGSWLSSAYSWEPEDALRISLAPMNHEDLMRLWDGFDLPYQLSVPYLVRTVRLGAREREQAPVTSRTLAVGSRLSP